MQVYIFYMVPYTYLILMTRLKNLHGLILVKD